MGRSLLFMLALMSIVVSSGTALGSALSLNGAASPLNAAPGNSDNAALFISVTDQEGDAVRGLGSANFEVDASIVAPGGALVDIKRVSEASRAQGFYIIEIAPTTHRGTQYTWKAGIYLFTVTVQRDADREETVVAMDLSGTPTAGMPATGTLPTVTPSVGRPETPDGYVEEDIQDLQDLAEETEICKNVFFSTEEDFVTQGPEPPDGNPIISDGDLLGPGCVVFARNRELLAAFKVEYDLGLDAADVIDAERRRIAFSTELDGPQGRFTAGDLLVTDGTLIPNAALLARFDIPRADLGLDAVHLIGDVDLIMKFLDQASRTDRDGWLKDPGMLPEMLDRYEIDIWFSTEGTPPEPRSPAFLDGDLLSAREGIIVARNSLLLPVMVPAGIPNRGVDFGLDAVTCDRKGNRERIHFSTEILREGEPDFTDGDVLLLGDGVVCTNDDLVRCFEPKARMLGLDALSLAIREESEPEPEPEPEPQVCYPNLPSPELMITGTEDYTVRGVEFTRYRLSIANWNVYPEVLFEPAPDLPPCGSNTESSRTWVDIYNQDDSRIYGFCALSSPANLRDLWFAVEKGQTPPESVYVTLTDRRCKVTYKSNQVTIREAGPNDQEPIEIYLADARESPGSVYRYSTTASPMEEVVYTRPSRNLYSFTFHPAIPEKLYYANANENRIYMTTETGTGWTSEEAIYTHNTYVRDVAFAFDRDGNPGIYFSESSGAGADGRIYKIGDDAASLFYEVKLSDVGGFWSGNFAFDNEGNLYLSSGNRVPASIYRVEDGTGTVEEIFRDDTEPISGLVYRGGDLYYANWRTKIYRLDLDTSEHTVVYSNPDRTWTSDVGFREVTAGSGLQPTVGSYSRIRRLVLMPEALSGRSA